MPATIKLDLEHIKQIIIQLNNKEKEELSKYLDKMLLKQQLNNFIQNKKDIDISLEEITQEVEIVRTERYK